MRSRSAHLGLSRPNGCGWGRHPPAAVRSAGSLEREERLGKHGERRPYAKDWGFDEAINMTAFTATGPACR